MTAISGRVITPFFLCMNVYLNNNNKNDGYTFSFRKKKRFISKYIFEIIHT
jgi:hypothetical protein